MSNKAAKRKARRREYERNRNIEKNKPKAKFRLDVLFDDGWKTMAGFVTLEQCRDYVAEQERVRKIGDQQILEGIIVELRKNNVIMHIPPFDPQDMKSAKAIEPKGTMSDVKSAKDHG